uniref:Cationic amino acid transporter C-terminal domain-containing protein n=1 Tax=Ciona savignyi TaxID=51511 RepID=H2Y6Z6_CIOSA
LKIHNAKNFTNALNRKRPIEAMRDDRRKSVTSTKLPKCLTTLDLTSLGVGSCGGTGMYVVSGMVAHEIAGPGVVFSFIIAGLVSLLSGMCYAEFGVRVPKTSGSAYTYSYVTIGEFTAFFIGWNLVLEYLIGTASGASAISSMIDSLTAAIIRNSCRLSRFLNKNILAGHDNPNSYPDFIALFIVLVMTAVIAAGVRNSVIFNNALNVVNILVWLFIIIAGICFADVENWRKYGGFFPHGWSGVLRGAATCFYAYIGFDIIATTGDECKEPHKSIPRAIIYSLAVCMTCYVTVSAILTLVLPYTLIHEESPLLDMFNHVGFWQAKYIISVGAFASLVVSLLGSLFPMPRVLYTMASDGLVFRFLGNVMKYTETPVIATVISGSIAAILALAVSLRDLIEMMSIGTLLAYTLVCLSVLLLRYQPVVLVDSRTNGCAVLPSVDEEHTSKIALLFCIIRLDSSIGKSVGCLVAGSKINAKIKTSLWMAWWAMLLLSFFIIILLVLILLVCQQPQNPTRLAYMAPCLPFLPICAIWFNTYLMLKLSAITWIRFIVWCFVGLFIYFGYGVWNSDLERNDEKFKETTYEEGMNVDYEAKCIHGN